METMSLLLATVLLPVLGGMFAFVLPASGRRLAVVFFAVATIAAAVVAGAMAAFEDHVIIFDFEGEWVGTLVAALDFALMGAFVVLAIWRRCWPALLFAVGQLAVLGWFEGTHWGGLEAEGTLLADQLTVMMVLITSVIGSLICIYAVKYMEDNRNQGMFFLFMLIFIGAMNGAILSNNLLWLFFFWEVTTLASFVLIAHDRTPDAYRSAELAFMITLGGGLALAAAIPIFYHRLDHAITLDALNATGSAALGAVVLGALALTAIAAFTKSAQVPFQSWLLGAMVAPTPVSALLHSSTMVNLGVYLLIRMSPVINLSQELSIVVALVGALSFLATAVLAAMQRNIKRLLAYSTISNLGLIVLCVGVAGIEGSDGMTTPDAIVAGMVILLFHAVSKGLLFLCAGVYDHEHHTKDIEEIGDCASCSPGLRLLVFIGIISMVLPPFGLFFGKLMVMQQSIVLAPLVIMVALGSAITVFYYGKWLGRMFSSRPAAETRDLDPLYFYPMATVAALAIWLGVMLMPMTEYVFDPFVSSAFPWAVLSDPYDMLVPVALITVAFLVAIAAAAAHFAGNPRSGAPIYTGGEELEPQVAASYLGGERYQETGTAVAYAAAAAIFALLGMFLLWIWGGGGLG